MIPETTIADISARVRLSEIAAQYFPVKRSGSRYSALCPFHNERTPSFFINDERGSFKCWGCGVGGSMFRFIMDMDRISFPEAVRKLGLFAGIEVAEEETDADRERKAIYRALDASAGRFLGFLLSRSGNEARTVLKARGFNKQICEEWGIGFAPSDYKLDGEESTLLKAGLLKELDGGGYLPRFRDRITFSIRNEAGNLVGFSGRAIGDHPAKYLNTPETSVFSKGKLFYGLEKAKREIISREQIVIVEGQIDCIRCHLHGQTNTVAPLGTSFTPTHAKIARRLAQEAVLVFDSDRAGEEAARKAFFALSEVGVRVRAFILPEKSDPDEFILAGGDIQNAIADAPLYPEAMAKALDVSTTEKRSLAVEKCAFALSRLDDGPDRDDLISKVATIVHAKPNQIRRKMAVGRNEARPVETSRTSESTGSLIAHLLHYGKAKAKEFDWSLCGDADIQAVMNADFEAGNQASIAAMLAALDPAIESAVTGITPDPDLAIKAIYRGLLEGEVRRKAESVASGGSLNEIEPILSALKNL